MKLNILNVLNQIASEEASVVLLNDPTAVWNLPNNEDDLMEDYLYYKLDTEMKNDDTWDMIEWDEKHGQDYSHWLKYLKKVLTFEEWLVQEEAFRSKYMVYRLAA